MTGRPRSPDDTTPQDRADAGLATSVGLRPPYTASPAHPLILIDALLSSSLSRCRRWAGSQRGRPSRAYGGPDAFRVPMDVTYAIQGGEPALLAYRRWRNISRDDLALQSGIPKDDIEAIEDGKMDIEEGMLDRLAAALKVPPDELI